MNSTAVASAGQADPSPVRAGRAGREAPVTVKGPWFVEVCEDFLDARKAPLSPLARWVFLILDHAAGRQKPYCWVGNEKLAAMTGLTVRGLRKVLDQLDSGGEPWVLRVEAEGAKKVRAGFVLLRRCQHGMPAADTPEKLAEARRGLLQARSAARPGARRRARPEGTTVPPEDETQREPPFPLRGNHRSPSEGTTVPPNDSPLNEPPENDRSGDGDRPSSTGGGGGGAGGRRWTEADVEERAREIHAELYQGLPAAVAGRDWKQWERRYRTITRLVFCGRLGGQQIRDAAADARQAGTNHRGKRFLARLRDHLAGKASPAPPPARRPAAAPAAFHVAPPDSKFRRPAAAPVYHQAGGPPKRYKGEAAAAAPAARVFETVEQKRQRLEAYRASLTPDMDPARRQLAEGTIAQLEKALAATEAGPPPPDPAPPAPDEPLPF